MRRVLPALAACVVVASTLTAVSGVGAADARSCSNSGTGVNIPVINKFLPRGGSATGPQKAMPAFNNGRTQTVSWVTGPLSPNKTYKRFGISGTDVGVAWDNGRGQTLMAFGDTFGNCLTSDQQWRHNALLRSSDGNLSDGVRLDGRGFVGEMFGAVGFDGIEKTTIPTAGISIGGKQYVNFMSVRSWGPASTWFTNYSATAVSNDNGRSWRTPQGTSRPNLGINGDAKFQQGAYVKGVGPDAGWVYQYGTPNGRFGAAHIARFRPNDILNLGAYQYWNGRGWTPSPDSARPIVRGPVTELSVAWSPYLNRYVMLDSPRGVLLRTAAHPQGPWSPARRIAPSSLELYAPMMLPNSPALRGSGPELYFNASRWDDYNVLLVRTKVRK
ncbi:MAG: DUF4185 domain-containing protein [Gordonia sp. (in: high G+C Gram-positive bacteria)]